MEHAINISLFRCNTYPLGSSTRTMKPHEHNTVEICYIMTGELVLHYLSKNTNQFENISLYEKQLVLIKPNCLHYTEIIPPLKTLGLEFVSKDGMLVDYLKHSPYVSQLPCIEKFFNTFQDVLILNDAQNLFYLLFRLKKYTTEPLNNFSYFDYDLDLKRLLLELLKSSQQQVENNSYNLHIRKALAYIQTNYFSDITPTTIAQHLKISTSYLQKLFRNILNTSLNASIHAARINKAKSLLSNTNLPLHTIAKSIGYHSTQVFITNFKNIMGCTPSDFRREDLKGEDFSYFLHLNYYKERKLNIPLNEYDAPPQNSF